MQLLTVKDVSAELQVSISMIYRLISAGELPCIEIGSAKRINKEDLDKFLKANRKEVVQLPESSKRHF